MLQTHSFAVSCLMVHGIISEEIAAASSSSKFHSTRVWQKVSTDTADDFDTLRRMTFDESNVFVRQIRRILTPHIAALPV